MLQDIDPLSVGVLFQNRYRIVRCLKGGPPTAVYDVVDEKTNACCLLEVAASGDVTMDDIGVHSEIEPCIGGLFEDEHNVKTFEPRMDERPAQPYFVLEPFDDDIDDGFDVDIPVYVDESSLAHIDFSSIPLPPNLPSFDSKQALPAPPPLRAQSSPTIAPPSGPISWPPPHFPPMDSETTLVDVPPLLPPSDVIASLPDPHESPLHASIEPLVVAAEQFEAPPSYSPQNSLRERFPRHRRVFITLAIAIAIVALGLLALLTALWTQRTTRDTAATTDRKSRMRHCRKSVDMANTEQLTTPIRARFH